MPFMAAWIIIPYARKPDAFVRSAAGAPWPENQSVQYSSRARS